MQQKAFFNISNNSYEHYTLLLVFRWSNTVRKDCETIQNIKLEPNSKHQQEGEAFAIWNYRYCDILYLL